MTSTTETEVKRGHAGDFIAKTDSEARLEYPTETLTLTKSEARWIQALLQVDLWEPLRDKEVLQAVVQPSTFPGGRNRSADHPNQIDDGYKTMSTWQLEKRAARWGHISPGQLEASVKDREQSGVTPPPGQADISPSKHRDLFRSYEQGVNQAVTHYLEVKWALFKQGWPDPAERSIAFGIADSVQGICNRCSLDRECILNFKDLLRRAVILVRRAVCNVASYSQSWHGLDLQGSVFSPGWTSPQVARQPGPRKIASGILQPPFPVTCQPRQGCPTPSHKPQRGPSACHQCPFLPLVQQSSHLSWP